VSSKPPNQSLALGQRAAKRPALSLKGRALKYLSQREHSALELRRKLAPHDEQGQLDDLLQELKGLGYLSELRFAQSLGHRKQSRLGSRAIAYQLKEYGVPAEASTPVIQALAQTDLERANALWQRRFSKPVDAGDWAKQMRFLVGRGFSADIARQVLRAGGSQELEEN
jgi:regulatory protein